MRALVKQERGARHLELMERDPIEPGPGEVLVRVLYAGVCTADVEIRCDRYPFTPPVTLGHEFVGIVEQVGPELDQLWPGDRVVAENTSFACGQCEACQKSYPNLCQSKQIIGVHTHGAFADYITLPGHLLKHVPDGIDSEAAALAEPLAASIHAVIDQAGVSPGDTVVVVGAGANGLLSAQAARAEGAGKVIVLGNWADTPYRLPVAAKLGFTTANYHLDPIREMIMEATNGAGADLVVETSGTNNSAPPSHEWLKRGGCLVETSLTGNPNTHIRRDGLCRQGIFFRFAHSSRHQNWTRGLQWIKSGAVQTDSLITHRAVLNDWEGAFDHMASPEGIRAVFTIGAEFETARTDMHNEAVIQNQITTTS